MKKKQPNGYSKLMARCLELTAERDGYRDQVIVLKRELLLLRQVQYKLNIANNDFNALNNSYRRDMERANATIDMLSRKIAGVQP